MHAHTHTPTRAHTQVQVQLIYCYRPEQVTQDHRIGEANVGHQLLKKMGWEGAGLGATEQGIQDPIKGGEVRSKADKYKASD